jgi:hypothetical protein
MPQRKVVHFLTAGSLAALLTSAHAAVTPATAAHAGYDQPP